MANAKPTEIAWAAGLFEGEGCWATRRRKRSDGSYYEGRAGFYPMAVMVSTDADVLDRFQKATGIGHFHHNITLTRNRGFSSPNPKPQDRWLALGFEKVQALGTMFWPYMGERRKAKWREVMLAYQGRAESSQM